MRPWPGWSDEPSRLVGLADRVHGLAQVDAGAVLARRRWSTGRRRALHHVLVAGVDGAVVAGVGDAHAGPHRHEDEEQEDGEAQEAGEAAPAQLAPAGPA